MSTEVESLTVGLGSSLSLANYSFTCQSLTLIGTGSLLNISGPLLVQGTSVISTNSQIQIFSTATFQGPVNYTSSKYSFSMSAVFSHPFFLCLVQLLELGC